MYHYHGRLSGAALSINSGWYPRLLDTIGSKEFSLTLSELLAVVGVAEICVVAPGMARVISLVSEAGLEDADLAASARSRHRKIQDEHCEDTDESAVIRHFFPADRDASECRSPRNRFVGETVIGKGEIDSPITVHLYYSKKNIGDWVEFDWILQAIYPLILAHYRLYTQTRLEKTSCEWISQRLQERFPELTEREVAVCARSVRGLTTEGISLDLGIKITTALTYRRRAYARLNISSLQQLSLLVLA